MKTAKILKHALLPTREKDSDPGVTIYSAEEFKLEHGECKSARTGIMFDIPEGNFLMALPTPQAIMKGVTVVGVNADCCEARVTLHNGHRDSFEVQVGTPLAYLLLVPVVTLEVEEVPEDDVFDFQVELEDRARNAFQEGDVKEGKEGRKEKVGGVNKDREAKPTRTDKVGNVPSGDASKPTIPAAPTT